MTDLTTAYLLGLATAGAAYIAAAKLRAWIARRRDQRARAEWRKLHMFRG